ncbi:MAG: tRNA pseudouridine(55) synthase TruB [Flavobacteriales bacterium]|nr:tRNA pseudouridine(55) synthase TruB [Flavobacteriales bacterium]
MVPCQLEKSTDFISGELLLIEKPLEWTSFDVVKKVRNLIKKKLQIKKIKVGHAGTLDPLATGLLIVCTGKFTKRIEEIQGQEKTYMGNFTLGATTPSFDKETKVNHTFDTTHITKQLLEKTAKQFVGEINQIPPIFSALKKDGKRLYNFARKNEEVEIKKRKVVVLSFEITDINLPEVGFKIRCSKGTYIRSIANDFGNSLNSGAYLSKLCRTEIGEYNLKDAFSLNQVEEKIKLL